MQKEDKERVVAELTEKLRSAETLIVADYRGLTMPQIDALRGQADRERGAAHGRQEHAHPPRGRGRRCGRAARAARGAVGDRVHREPTATWSPWPRRSPTRRARRRSSRSAAASCRAARSPARTSRSSRSSRRSTCCAARCSARSSRRSPRSPALVNAPLQNLYGLIDARIEQLQAGDTAAAEPAAAEPAAEEPRTEEAGCRGRAAAESAESRA